YDCVNVDAGKQLRSVESSSTLKFFTNVQGKTKLETNLQSASLLPHYNTFEARALRVVISDLPPDFVPDNPDDEETVDNGEEDLDKKAPAPQQLIPNNGAGTLIGNLVYNTVTSLYVGEKLMIEMPTWFFPAGAGPYSEAGKFTTHGEPSPVATFRFAEPIFID